MNFVVLDTRYSGIYLKLSELGDLARTKRVTDWTQFPSFSLRVRFEMVQIWWV